MAARAVAVVATDVNLRAAGFASAIEIYLVGIWNRRDSVRGSGKKLYGKISISPSRQSGDKQEGKAT